MVCYLQVAKVTTSSSSFSGSVRRLSRRCIWAPHSGALHETKDNEHKLKTSKDGNCITSLSNLLHCLSVETSSLYGQTSSGAGYPERLCSVHPCRFSKLGKAQSSLVWSCRWPCFEQEIGIETSQWLFPPELSHDPVKASRKAWKTIYIKIM